MWDQSKFDKKDYWEQVCNHADSQIDWYGDFKLLGAELNKDLTSTQLNILIPGGGFSTLSCELERKGYKKIIHSDVSSSCIEQMKAKYQADYPTIKFRVCDVLETPYKDKNFDVIIDKALFDSLYCSDTDEHRNKAEKYVKQMARVLRPKGKFIVITLAQSFVIEHLMYCFHKYFKSLDARVIIPEIDDPHSDQPSLASVMPITYMVFSHRNYIGGDIKKTHLRYCNEPVESVSNILYGIKLQQHINYTQYYCNYTKDIGVVRFETTSNKTGTSHFIIAETQLDSSQVTTDYIIVTLDEIYMQDISFILDEGVIAMAKKHKVTRVCFIMISAHLLEGENKTHLYKLCEFAANFQHISFDMNESVQFVSQRIDYIPISINYPIDCYASDLGGVKGSYEILQSNDIFIVTRSYIKYNDNQVITSNQTMERQLIFKSNPLTIQSSIILDFNCNYITNRFTSEYHCAVVILLFAIKCDNWNVVCIGLGGGQLSSFVSNLLPIKSIVTVEMDERLTQIATKFFGFEQSPACTVVIKEGVEYIRSMQPNSVDCVIYDVNNNCVDQDIVCPLPTFIKNHTLDHVLESLTPNGVLIMNVVARNDDALSRLLVKIRGKFSCVYSYLMQEDENVVVIAFNSQQIQPPKINIPQLMLSDKFKSFKSDQMFKTVLRYFISKTSAV